MPKKLLYDPQGNVGKPMRVAGFMSGSGTNIRKILEKERDLKKQEKRSPYELVFLFSDVADPAKCKIREIAEEYRLSYKINDMWEFYRARGNTTKRDMNVRREYDKVTLGYLEEHKINCVALGGYMSIVTEVIFQVYPTINVHPADLSIIDEHTGKRKYTGDHAVRDAILAGEPQIRASTHLATAAVDGGPLLLISKPVTIKRPLSISLEELKTERRRNMLENLTNMHQDELKKVGDWVIFPLSLMYIAKGLVVIDEKGSIYIENQPRPQGLRL
ncbi:MAG TPA: formyltransferase family protein [Candidatus Deferrimicrobium sp.]|nr:formyltransferase family protein [Candidatus Deferrimicrobium sp.]